MSQRGTLGRVFRRGQETARRTRRRDRHHDRYRYVPLYAPFTREYPRVYRRTDDVTDPMAAPSLQDALALIRDAFEEGDAALLTPLLDGSLEVSAPGGEARRVTASTLMEGLNRALRERPVIEFSYTTTRRLPGGIEVAALQTIRDTNGGPGPTLYVWFALSERPEGWQLVAIRADRRHPIHGAFSTTAPERASDRPAGGESGAVSTPEPVPAS